jgi:hypothetical protein
VIIVIWVGSFFVLNRMLEAERRGVRLTTDY